nr:transmembrane protein 144 [Hymenolepis microstoma]
MNVTEVLNETSTTTTGSVSLTSPIFGYIAIVVCAVGFGTNYLPVKKFNMGDGMFFQWMMCNAILLVGIIVNCAVGCPKFYPLAMFGGALWAVGNSLSVTIIKAIGVGLGIIIWSMSNLLFGFATSRFGWFGIAQKIPKKPIMNYIGVAIALGSVIIFATIKPNQPESKESADRDAEADEVVRTDRNTTKTLLMDERENSGRCGRICKPVSSMPLAQRRIIGVLLAVIAGSLYGNTFVPTQFIQTRYEGASMEGLHYVFGNFVGIWMASTAIFIIYALCKRNRPWIPSSNAIIPALISGVLWGTAQSAWFVANAALGEPVTFPIITTCPALIATLCGTIFFREIRISTPNSTLFKLSHTLGHNPFLISLQFAFYYQHSLLLLYKNCEKYSD